MAQGGTVVVLNGAPAAGKRDIARAVQAGADRAFLTIGLGFLYGTMIPPPRAGAPVDAATHRRYLEALHVCVSAHARRGCNVIVDHTLIENDWRDELRALLAGLDVVWVDVRVPDDVLLAREAAHGPRPEGSAVALRARLAGGAADLTVDGRDSAAAAAAVLRYLAARSMRGQPYARWVPTDVPPRADAPGRVIALIGSSSAGKSTLCRAVQTLAEARGGAHVVYMGIDTALDTLPERYFGIPFYAGEMAGYAPGPDGRLGFSYVAPGPSPDNPSPYPQQQCGPVARALISGQLNSVAALSRAGLHVVGDHIWVFRDWHEEAARRWAGLPLLTVAVTCDDAVLAEHERLRGDRLPGWALGQRAQMYMPPTDLVIDTGRMTPEQEAARILDAAGLS